MYDIVQLLYQTSFNFYHSADDPDRQGGYFFLRIKMRRVGQCVVTYQRDTGLVNLRSWWDIKSGKWLDEQELNGTGYCMVGETLANEKKLSAGDTIRVKGEHGTKDLEVVGVFESGDDEDKCIFTTLTTAQELTDTSGLIKKIEVSAITSPDDELAVKAAKNPSLLTGDEYDLWYCTAYVSSICFQIQEAVPEAAASAVRQIADSEGKILEKTELLMSLITLMSLIGATLGISNLVTSGVMERSQELALLKAVGAKNGQITRLVLTETILTSVTLLGSIPAIRLVLRLRPSEVLHGGH